MPSCNRPSRQENTLVIMNARSLIGGRWVTGAGQHTQLLDKFSGEPLCTVEAVTAEQAAEAVQTVEAAQHRARLSPYERCEILRRAADSVAADTDRLIDTIMVDTGFVRADAATEVARTVQTLRLSAEAARQVSVGEMVPLDAGPGGNGRLGFTLRFPVGVVVAITPFNSPLNTVAHKVAPALAAGNGVVLKPATATPLSANALAEHLLAAGLPEGLLAVVHGEGSTVGQALLEDPRVGFYTLTGSTAVGRIVVRAAGLRRTQLELGSIASTLICEDADLSAAVPKVVSAGLRKSGQVCTSVQRLYVARAIADDLTDTLAKAIATLRAGDPADPDTAVGPLISRADADRVSDWIAAARAKGADVVTGGDQDGAVVGPTLLAAVDEEMDVMRREIFGPVICIIPFDDLAEAVDRANDTPYGLAAGIFTRDLDRALWAARNLRFGAVHVNEASSSLVDLMPFGGVKESGHGHEGPIYAAREMTEERLVTITTTAPTRPAGGGR
jgi:succinate-semialdehyde dehydrogenase/glutarate-semialdehyde dehydrogenase